MQKRGQALQLLEVMRPTQQVVGVLKVMKEYNLARCRTGFVTPSSRSFPFLVLTELLDDDLFPPTVILGAAHQG